MIKEHTSKVLERQMRNWELVKAQRPPKPEVVSTEVEDFICISREIGVEGKAVAEAVAKTLGWPVFGREILDVMAGDDFDRKQIYSSMDERDLSWAQGTLRSFFEVKFVRNDYFHRLCETLLLLSRKGNAVFLGRGADLILPPDIGFRIRLTAPREQRIERIAKKKHLAPTAARLDIQRNERQRSQFFKHHFKVASDDPSRFDMTLNLGRWTVDRAAAMILEARKIHHAAALAA